MKSRRYEIKTCGKMRCSVGRRRRTVGRSIGSWTTACCCHELVAAAICGGRKSVDRTSGMCGNDARLSMDSLRWERQRERGGGVEVLSFSFFPALLRQVLIG
jgi:hypothetical protein